VAAGILGSPHGYCATELKLTPTFSLPSNPARLSQDASLATLKACERLALSTNQIDRMTSFAGMENLKILTLSRNMLKKIEKLEDVAATLEELWISYNLISTLDGLSACQALQVLYAGQNRIADWAEVEKLSALPLLRDLLLAGNPIETSAPDNATYRAMIIKRVPQVQKIDNIMVSPIEREKAASL
jgi:dynein light chain 1